MAIKAAVRWREARGLPAPVDLGDIWPSDDEAKAAYTGWRDSKSQRSYWWEAFVGGAQWTRKYVGVQPRLRSP